MGLILPHSFMFPASFLPMLKPFSWTALLAVSRVWVVLVGVILDCPLYLLPLLVQKKIRHLLASSTKSYGAVFFGDGPYNLPGIDVSKSLTYTPLILNPVSTASTYFQGDASTEYFINVTSIKIKDKVVSSFNSSLLTIDENGYGGTKISTVHPYTVLETTIYNAVVNAFVNELSHVPRVTAVAPFGAYFNSTNIVSTRVGLAVPTIDLVLQSERVYWRIFGANSMVQVTKGVLCLGFVDNGQSSSNPRTNIVIGGHQIEDNLLQFDFASSRLGFSSSLLFRQTTCGNFNFTSVA